MITSEFHVPYDRIKLSKILGPDPKSIQLFDQACYESLKVELKLGMLVENVDFKLKTISIKDQEIPITYDKVILASGMYIFPGHEFNKFRSKAVLQELFLRSVPKIC